MFIKKSSEFDKELVSNFEKILDSQEQKPECDKVKKVVSLLSEACELLEGDDKFDKVCKKIMKAIEKLADVVNCEPEEITSSEDAEEDVQEEIEEQRKEASYKKATDYSKGNLCTKCKGTGYEHFVDWSDDWTIQGEYDLPCSECNGAGKLLSKNISKRYNGTNPLQGIYDEKNPDPGFGSKNREKPLKPKFKKDYPEKGEITKTPEEYED